MNEILISFIDRSLGRFTVQFLERATERNRILNAFGAACVRIDLHNIDTGGLQGYNPQVGQLWNITRDIPHGIIRFFNLHIKYIFESLHSLPFSCLFLFPFYLSKPLDTYLYTYPRIHLGFYEIAYSIWVDVQKNRKNEKIQLSGEFVKQEIVHYMGSSPALRSGDILCDFIVIIRFLLFAFLNNLSNAILLI